MGKYLNFDLISSIVILTLFLLSLYIIHTLRHRALSTLSSTTTSLESSGVFLQTDKESGGAVTGLSVRGQGLTKTREEVVASTQRAIASTTQLLTSHRDALSFGHVPQLPSLPSMPVPLPRIPGIGNRKNTIATLNGTAFPGGTESAGGGLQTGGSVVSNGSGGDVFDASLAAVGTNGREKTQRTGLFHRSKKVA